MNRRAFVIGLGAVLTPFAAEAQSRETVQRIGIIYFGGSYQVLVDGLRQVLREVGPRRGQTRRPRHPGHQGSEGCRGGGERSRTKKSRPHLHRHHVRHDRGETGNHANLALQGLDRLAVDAYFHTQDALVLSHADLVIEAARAKRLPTMFNEVGRVARGALAAYGQNHREIGRMAAKYVQQILAETDPKDLPIENYDKLEFAFNLRTARALGLTIPPSLLLRADQVIE